MSPSRALAPSTVFDPIVRGSTKPLVLLAVVLTVTMALLVAGNQAAGANSTESDQFASVQIETLETVPWEAGLIVGSQVTVTTERAISGVLTIVSSAEGQSRTTYEYDIDVGADATVTLPVDLFTGWNGVEATATLTSGGDVIAGDELQAFGQGNGNNERAAVYGLELAPARVPLIGSEEQIRTFVLGDRLDGLERASSLITTPAAVTGLGSDSDEFLRGEAWVRGGGQLVIDGPRNALGDDFHRYPTANENRYLLGAGSVVYLDDWEDGIPLGGYLGRSGLRELIDSQDLGSGAAGELAILAGISLPSAGTVALILLAYSIIAGPVAYAVLASRGMQRKMWGVLPALSALFVVGILGFGFASRTGRSDTHITIVEVNEQASRATSNLLLTSSVGGGRGIETPAGWTYLGQGRTEAQRPVKLRPGTSSTEISIETPPGSSSLARVSGVATQFDGMLTIDNISYEDGMVTAEVTNNGEANLTHVIAILGDARAEIGLLSAGTSESFQIESTDVSGRTMRELLVWPRVRREWNNNGQVAIPTDREAPTAAGAWTEWRTDQGSSAMPETTLGVVGWTDDLPGPIAGVEEGRTALFARQNIPADVSESLGFTTTARMVSRNGEPAFAGNFEGYPEDYRITLSEGFDPQDLAVLADRNSASVGFLTTDGWQYAALPGRGDVLLAVPPEAILDGEIMVRSSTPPWSWGTGLTLNVVTDPDAENPNLLAEPQFRNVDGDEFGFEGPFNDPGMPRPLELGVAADVELLDEPVTFDGDILSGTYDSYTVTLEEGASLVATMASQRGDSYLELIDSDGQLITSNDDYGRNVDSQIQFTAATAGDYEIRAQALDSGGITYSLQLEVTS